MDPIRGESRKSKLKEDDARGSSSPCVYPLTAQGHSEDRLVDTNITGKGCGILFCKPHSVLFHTDNQDKERTSRTPLTQSCPETGDDLEENQLSWAQECFFDIWLLSIPGLYGGPSLEQPREDILVSLSSDCSRPQDMGSMVTSYQARHCTQSGCIQSI